MTDVDTTPLRGIGGWLILPVIGSFIAPFLYGHAFVETLGLIHRASERLMGVAFLDLISSILFITGWIYAIYLLIRLRKAYPITYSVLMGASVVKILVGLIWMAELGISTSSLGAEFGRSIIPAVIWIPYMFLSNRVKATFVN